MDWRWNIENNSINSCRGQLSWIKDRYTTGTIPLVMWFNIANTGISRKIYNRSLELGDLS